MAQIDEAVITAARGYLFTAPVGTAPPRPSVLEAADFDPRLFGTAQYKITVSGDPDSFTLKAGTTGPSTTALDLSSTPEEILSAIEALPSVGVGNVDVKGKDAATGLTVSVIGDLSGKTLTFSGTATGGTSPEVTVEQLASPNGWENLGHTSREDLPEFGYKGGEYDLRGTWQQKRLRLVQDKSIPVDSVTIKLEQWDVETMELYFGKDAAPEEDGVFGVDGNFVPVERALLIIIVDGDIAIGFYSPKAAFTREAAIKTPLDDFVALPVKAVFLNLGARRLYDWISSALFKKELTP
ncbi:MAG: phage tail tube protein [Isosphaeraceae bacterium]